MSIRRRESNSSPETTKIKPLLPRQFSEDELASMSRRRKNRDFFQAERVKVLGEHGSKHIIVYKDEDVRSFDRRSEMHAFIRTLDDLSRRTVYIAPGPSTDQLVRSTGYRRVVRP